ncbi:hypothetical protein QTP70_022830 [Hemibagrus guttatus]|uniref:Uncharacterized protein n=1 Tax=Hemibagrus guttatus TaxID=175788 RepID=A0AAE0PZV7_9TELE|nr:hypothetical protein QTP70_022830 [Hemibagrus guttatus]
MALATRVLFRSFLARNAGLNSRNMKGVTLSRNAVTSTSGAILPKPDKGDWGHTPLLTLKLTLSRISAITCQFIS